MSDKIKNLKSYFNNGDVPTEAQFHELIDSFMLKSSDKLITSAKLETNGDAVFTFSDNTTLTIPKYKLPASMPISFISGLQAAIDAKAAKNGDATQNFKVKDAAANDDAISKQQMDAGLATKAAKNGDATQSFKVKDAAANDDAVNKQQMDTGLATKAAKNGDATQNFKVKDATANDDAVSKQQMDAGLATKAAKNGDATQNFKVKDATANDDAISKQQMDAGLATKAVKSGEETIRFKAAPAQAPNEVVTKSQLDALSSSLIPAPHIATISPLYMQPDALGTLTIEGSYFTPNTTVTIANQTISEFKFISDNKITVKVKNSTTAGEYDITLNNGRSTVAPMKWFVSLGEVIKPKPSDFTLVSGQLDLTETGKIKLKHDNTTGKARFFPTDIPLNQDFQLRFKAVASPISTNSYTDGHDYISIIENGTERYRASYWYGPGGIRINQVSNGFSHTNSIHYESGFTLADKQEFILERKGSTMSFKKGTNTLKVFTDLSNTGGIKFEGVIKNFDFEVMYIKL